MYSVKNFEIGNGAEMATEPLLIPVYVMFSAHMKKGFEGFVKGKGIDYIIEKPPN